MNENVMIERALVAASKAEACGFVNTSKAFLEVARCLNHLDKGDDDDFELQTESFHR